jgi:CheY-like chemotaxis protein
VAGYRVLIVDDDAALRRLLADAFERAGYEVTEAVNGDQALKIAKKAPVDVLITDLLMPEKEGLELIRHFRKDLREVIVIAVSGEAAQHLKTARLLGAQVTFEKPFKSEDLVETVARLINERPPASKT